MTLKLGSSMKMIPMDTDLPKIEVWITDLYILNVASEHDTMRIRFPDPSGALKAYEALSASEDVKAE